MLYSLTTARTRDFTKINAATVDNILSETFCINDKHPRKLSILNYSAKLVLGRAIYYVKAYVYYLIASITRMLYPRSKHACPLHESVLNIDDYFSL